MSNSQVAFCPHCGNTAPQTLLLKHFCRATAYGSDGSKDEEGLPVDYFVAECQTCHELLVYCDYMGFRGEGEFHKADMVYPTGVDLHESIPSTVRDCYSEAARIHNAASQCQ